MKRIIEVKTYKMFWEAGILMERASLRTDGGDTLITVTQKTALYNVEPYYTGSATVFINRKHSGVTIHFVDRIENLQGKANLAVDMANAPKWIK